VELPFISSPTHPSESKPWLNAIGSCGFLNWQQQCSYAFTTFHTGKLFLVGRKFARGEGTPVSDADQTLPIFERTYNHRMGMCSSLDGQTICLSSRYRIWRLEQYPTSAVPYRAVERTVTDGDEMQHLPDGARRGNDLAYIPRVSDTTGHIDVHELAVDADGRVVFVDTMFGWPATFSERANFKPLWRPPFLSALIPEDCFHLSYLAMHDGRPAFVTVASHYLPHLSLPPTSSGFHELSN
jgi:uncharacterized protein (TIGR03032 family)